VAVYTAITGLAIEFTQSLIAKTLVPVSQNVLPNSRSHHKIIAPFLNPGQPAATAGLCYPPLLSAFVIPP
jgi:hypothetical protein